MPRLPACDGTEGSKEPPFRAGLEASVVALLFLSSAYSGGVSVLVSPENNLSFYSGETSLYRMSFDLPFSLLIFYLVWRSNRGWSAFGMSRPRWIADSLLAMMISLSVFLLQWNILQVGWTLCPEALSLGPRLPAFQPAGLPEGLLAFTSVALGSFTEELVMRAYLITRLNQVIRSRSWCVLLTSVLFAGYHCYQGIAGVVGALVFGMAYGAFFCLLRRLWPLALAHIMHNFAILALPAG